MPYARMTHDVDPKKVIHDELGDISEIELFHNQVLAAIYIRPEKTKSGLYLSNNTREEDKWQGKVGLIVKTGPDAFKDDTGKWFNGVNINVGDWIYFRPSDGGRSQCMACCAEFWTTRTFVAAFLHQTWCGKNNTGET